MTDNNPPEISSEEADAIQEVRGRAQDETNTAMASAQSAGTVPLSIGGSKGRKDNDGTLAQLERQRDIAAGSPPNAGGNSARQPVNWDEIERQRRIVQTKFGGKRVESQETDGA